jgi:hypothetical protein
VVADVAERLVKIGRNLFRAGDTAAAFDRLEDLHAHGVGQCLGVVHRRRFVVHLILSSPVETG